MLVGRPPNGLPVHQFDEAWQQGSGRGRVVALVEELVDGDPQNPLDVFGVGLHPLEISLAIQFRVELCGIDEILSSRI